MTSPGSIPPSPSSPSNVPRLLAAALVLLLGGGAAWMTGHGAPVLLGIVEGITEFLPISSTGHLLVTEWVIQFKGGLEGTFAIFIQLGAVVAVVLYYLRNLLGQARALLGKADDPVEIARVRRLWLGIVLAFLPAAGVGLTLHGLIKRHLFQVPVVALALVVGGVALLWVEKARREAPRTHDLLDVTPRQAFTVGLAQVLALVPGVSRSGASIVGGLLVGMDRVTATAFSFYLALPTLGGATVVDLAKSLRLVGPEDALRLVIGTGVSFIVAYLSIGWLLRYVSKSSFVPFGYYRIAAGLALFALSTSGWIGR